MSDNGQWETYGKKRRDSSNLKSYLTNLIKAVGPDTLASAVDTPLVSELAAKRSAEKDKRCKKICDKRVSNGQVRRSCLDPLSAVMNYARDELHLRLPEFPNFKKIKKKYPEKKHTFVITSQQEALITEALPEGYCDAFEFGELTGLRRRVVIELQWRQVDWERMRITTIGKHDKQLFTPITPKIEELLKSQEGIHKSRIFTFVAERKNHRLGYVKGQRYPLNYHTYGTWWARRIKTNDETKDLRIHDARHTFGQNFQDAQGDLRLTQQVMGHRDIGTTMRYLQGMTGAAREAMVAAEAHTTARKQSAHQLPTKVPTRAAGGEGSGEKGQ